MTDTTHETSTVEMSVGCRTAETTAKVAGVFAIIFLVLLVGNFIGTSVLAPRRENRLTAMKVEVQGGEATEEQLAKIRQLDLEIRRDRIWRLDFARKTSYALLVSVVLFVVAGKLVGTLSKQPPRPQHAPDVGAELIREARRSRWSVTAGLAALAGVVALLVVQEAPSAFVEAKEAGPSYASMQEKSEQWHRFRGPGGGGVSVFSNIPTQWDGATGQGILWKTPVPVIGHNSPVVWKDRVFLSGADPNQRQVFCYDATSGKLLWTGDVPTTSAVAQAELEVMPDTGYSASTTATDGYRIYAIFVTGDIAAFDFNGRRLWHKNLDIPDSAYGYASSLETYQDRVIVQFDQGDGSENKSRLYALDGTTGRVVWQEVREEVPNSWTSPILVDVEGKLQIITVTDPWVFANDPADGAEIWRAECVSGDVAPSPIYAGGLIMAIEPYSQMVAIKPTGQGNVTETHIAWRMEEGAPDICCPVGNDKYVFLLEGSGYLTCFDITNGESVYEHDLRDNFMASPSIAAGKLYLLSEEGVMYIAELGPEYQEITKCELQEKCHASPAFVDGRIYIRGAEHLYCIGQAAAADQQADN
ncbi:MAG: PQQ-like beta-propeller repeat protein [Phycisphaerales bacterium]|nr:MAG: PQQ-like beta-propeller repeat protein [Phycisphaerales bacterium]